MASLLALPGLNIFVCVRAQRRLEVLARSDTMRGLTRCAALRPILTVNAKPTASAQATLVATPFKDHQFQQAVGLLGVAE